MATIQKEVKISGICLMTGKENTVTLFPSDKGEIVFYPPNCQNGIKASLENVISTEHCTVLGNATSQVMLVEHFMAACALAGIDSLDVCMEFIELPILDGSSKQWVELFNEAGITDKGENNSQVEINEPVHYSHNNTNIVMIPANSLKISYIVNFDHPDLINKWYSWTPDKGIEEIAEARTYGYLKDLEKFQQAGFALGAKVDNIVGLTETGYTTDLRSEYEPIKHKILDILGDLMLTGVNPLNLKAHIIAQQAGHTSHVQFAKLFKNKICTNV